MQRSGCPNLLIADAMGWLCGPPLLCCAKDGLVADAKSIRAAHPLLCCARNGHVAIFCTTHFFQNGYKVTEKRAVTLLFPLDVRCSRATTPYYAGIP
jgi:hypothetical protein